MGEENDDKGNNKQEKNEKKSKGPIGVIIVILVIILLIPACYLVIIQEGILTVITDVVNNVMGFLSNPAEYAVKMWKGASNQISSIFGIGSYQLPESNQITIILKDDDVKTIKEQIESQAIETDKVGLTDDLIKKMILVNYMTSCTDFTEVGLPLGEDEVKALYEKGLQFHSELTGNHKIVLKCNDGMFNYWTGDGVHGEDGMYYMSVMGIVHLIDERGQTIYSFDSDNFNQIASDCKNATNTGYRNGIKNAMKCAYTIDKIGSIKMNKLRTTETDTIYSYMDNEIINEKSDVSISVEPVVLEYSQYISQYTMPMDFLVSLLEITGSDGFVEAVCELVGDSKIELVIASSDTYDADIYAEKYQDEVTVDGIQNIERDISTTTTDDDGKTTTKISSKNDSQEVSVIDTQEVKKQVNKYINDMSYNVYVKSVNTWYCKADYDVSSDIKAIYTVIDKDGNEVKGEKEFEDANLNDGPSANFKYLKEIVQGVDENVLWVDKNIEPTEIKFATRYEDALDWEKVSKLTENEKDKDKYLSYYILSEVCANKDFFTNEDLNKDIEKPSSEPKTNVDGNNNKEVVKIIKSSFEQPRVTKMTENMKDAKYSQMKVSMGNFIKSESVNSNYEDNTDRFLGLLKNDTGVYTKGATYNANGKKVKYNDVYGGQSEVGDLLENGSDMLFQFMESTSAYNKGLENVMKYIMYRYSNEDFGVTSFDDAINWLKESEFSSLGSSSYTECLHKMMSSYEGALTTRDGTKYLLLDGYNNDGFHSISTAYGIMFYEDLSNIYMSENEMNQAYKDCGQTNMTLDKAISGLIDSNGQIKYYLVSNNAFPESYALDKEVVDRVCEIKLSYEMEKVKSLLAIYNSRMGKNLTLNDAQICAIVDAGWNFGPYHKDAGYEAFMQQYFSLGDKGIDSLKNSYLPFYYEISGYPNVKRRSESRWKLFKEGVFTLSDGTVIVPSNGDSVAIVDAAKKLVELTKYGGREQARYGNPRHSSSGYDSSVYVCASFVSEVLYNACGYRGWSDNCLYLSSNLIKDSNFELVYYNATSSATPVSANISSSVNLNFNLDTDLRPGDVVVTFDNYSYDPATYKHVTIYIGDGKNANHGGSWGGPIEKDYPNISNSFFNGYGKNNIKCIFRYKGS